MYIETCTSNATTLRVSVVQTDIVWQDPLKNLEQVEHLLRPLCGQTDLVLLPETFATGFGAHPATAAQTAEGCIIQRVRHWTSSLHMAIAGTYLALDYDNSSQNGQPYYANRAFLSMPNGQIVWADKRHLFRNERKVCRPGHHRIIINYLGWNICLLVCYDLRFPVWSRNTGLTYDLCLYSANWPASRRHAWDVLLSARALENQAYIVAANRIGNDPTGTNYDGGSKIISPTAHILAQVDDNHQGTVTTILDKTNLNHFRQTFDVWRDADSFNLSSGDIRP